MKIRKVEIQAFRAYDEVKDCTFNFDTADGLCADFISLYAPNGFGKTSFYDAVEWGVTNNIYRFTRQESMNKDYAHDEKQLKFELNSQKSPQYILRNKNSPAERSSYVKLHVQGSDLIRERHLEPVPRVDSTDYHFDEKKTENTYFRDVILSQDNIDAFLREDDPQIRYHKFMEFFGDKDLDRYYTNILCLIRANDNRIGDLEQELKKLQMELPLDVDNEILDKVNIKILELGQLGEIIKKIEPDYTDQDFIDFTNLISDRKIRLIKNSNDTKDELEQLKVNEVRINDFLILQGRIKADQSKLDELLNHQLSFGKLSALKNEMANKVIEINKVSSDIKRLEDILKALPTFLKSEQMIGEQTAEIENQKRLFASEDEQLRNLNKQLGELKVLIDQSNGALYQLLQQQTDLPDLTANINVFEKQAEALLQLTKDQSQKLNEADENIVNMTARQRMLESDIQQITKNDYSSNVRNDNACLSFITIIDKKSEELNRLNAEIKQIEFDIASHSSLNNELKQLAVLSAGLLNKTKNTACPVCSHEYDSFDDLYERVTNNPLLNTVIQEKILQKGTITQSVTKIVEEIASAKGEILKIKTDQLNSLKADLNQLNSTKAQLLLINNESKSSLQLAEGKLKEIFIKLEGLSISDFAQNVQIKINDLQQDISSKNADLAKLNQESEKIKTFLETWKKNMGLIEAGIQSYRLSTEYLLIDEYIRRNNLTKEITKEDIQTKIDSGKLNMSRLSGDEKKLSADIRQLTDNLKQFSEINLATEIQSLENLIKDNRLNTGTFIQYFINNLHLTTEVYEKEILENSFTKEKARLNQLLKSFAELLENYEQVDSYKTNVLPFLKFKASESRITLLNKDIVHQKNKVGKELSAEKERLSAFINAQIESFFYEDLINQLYKKIDPHPEYKRIKFKCDFNGEKPKLNVFVSGQEETHLIPNLYFSTAQMNILSLSIFLAKALNAHDKTTGESIDCIFIDDPIQSMDSINILSTIDLLRSIVMNFNKQIILSTHDENFHYLLQKKMPPGLFNSKFLELETFGKVKDSIMIN